MKTLNAMRKVINENGEVKNFDTDNEFLEYAQKVYKENEIGQPYESEIHWMPENIQQAEEYIHEYCLDLEITDYKIMNTLTPMSKRTAEDIYLEYVNDWLTIDAMAENYGIEPQKLAELITSVKYTMDEE